MNAIKKSANFHMILLITHANFIGQMDAKDKIASNKSNLGILIKILSVNNKK